MACEVAVTQSRSPVWLLSLTQAAFRAFSEQMDRGPKAFSFAFPGLTPAWAMERNRRGGLPLRDDPGLLIDGPATLKIADKDWRPDFIPNGVKDGFVSARLRELLDPEPGAVQWLPVDVGRSPPDVRAMGYSYMQVLTCANPFDMARSSYRRGPVTSVDGAVTETGWIFDGGTPPDIHLPDLPLDPDFAPPCSVFFEAISGQLLVTDPVAERIQQAGIAGLMLRDPSSTYGPIANDRIRLRLPGGGVAEMGRYETL